MASCKDCIHYEVCKDYIETLAKAKNADLEAISKWLDEMTSKSAQTDCECEHFKDRSLFVKLPCKVGDPYFEIEQYCTERGFYNEPRQTDIMDCEYCDDDGVCDRQYRITEKRFISLIQIFDYKEKVVDRYNRIFLTKEEAEQALKKKEEKENGKC